MMLPVRKIVDHAIVPTRNNDTDAGLDLYSSEDVILKPGQVTKVSTGIAVAIPPGHVGLIWDRSSMGAKAIKVFGGVIDSGYRGDIMVVLGLMNTFERDWVKLPAGSKIAQLLIQKVELFYPNVVDDITFHKYTSQRGTKGFGSSGA